jgi:hypothetical protein
MDNFGDDDDDDFDEAEAEAEMADMLAQSNKNHDEQLKLAKKQMRHELLDRAILISKGWFWGFLPHAVKLQRIAEAFDILENLTED